MIFYQFKETCEIILDYPEVVGENIKEFSKDAFRNILYAYIDVYSRRLIESNVLKNYNHIVPTYILLIKVGMI